MKSLWVKLVCLHRSIVVLVVLVLVLVMVVVVVVVIVVVMVVVVIIVVVMVEVTVVASGIKGQTIYFTQRAYNSCMFQLLIKSSSDPTGFYKKMSYTTMQVLELLA